MTLPLLAVAWLGGIYAQSLLQAPAWILWLALPLPVAIATLWWREWPVRLGPSCALFFLLGALRYNAAIMGGLSLIAIIAGRQTYALASLAAAALPMTLRNPLVLWDVGFQLSFAATLGLVLLVRPWEDGVRTLLSRWITEERATALVRLLSEPLFVTLAAQLAVWPITLYYFRRFSLVSPITNFLRQRPVLELF